MRQAKFWATAALLVLLALPAAAEEDWTLAKSEDGVTVYTRVVSGSPIKEFRATTVVPAPLKDVLRWWRDPSTFPEWINRCVEARRVVGESGATGNHLKFNFPFPASDRDVVIAAKMVEESANHVVYEGSNVEGIVPETRGYVRVPELRSRWEFRAKGEAATEVSYRQHMDAGGRLPAFILNRASIDNPFRTLQGLTRYAEKHRSR
jgi:hypothetical protein